MDKLSDHFLVKKTHFLKWIISHSLKHSSLHSSQVTWTHFNCIRRKEKEKDRNWPLLPIVQVHPNALNLKQMNASQYVFDSHLRISWQSCSCILSLVSAHMWRRGTPLWSRSSCARCTWFGHFIIHGHFLSYELFLDTRDTMWSTRFWNLNQISVFSQLQVSMVTTLGLGCSVQFSQTISLIMDFKQF